MTDTNDTEVTTAQAFEAVRHELSLLHNAVANLTAARERIPDHTAALEGIDRSLGNVRARLAAIEQTPAISLTPAEMAKQINLAAQTVRTEDRRMLDNARAALDKSAGQIDGVVKRGQTADQQIKRQIWSAAVGVLAGIIVCAVLPGAIARSLPASWHVPEWMAARTMNIDQRAAGERMIATARRSERL
ncbi:MULTISPECIES: DUF6118 family protein [unclassified Novosphingobium]|uniref:DUF6118 family protein n=1 Tax=unclassified Novosphingobium TaxID=2644732 RepID=UPI00146EC7E9|nr:MULTISPECIES: DUF6118 family protein [unclassified Novosphingobium]NMN07519.1 hypothetical protein [Novosphingobium sp. SG919]NMN89794.1 hypothetical protein [Novosphingobium sp. SG916]